LRGEDRQHPHQENQQTFANLPGAPGETFPENEAK